MANIDRANGFKTVKSLLGAPWNGLVRKYSVAATQSTGIFIGDAVILNATGTVEQAATTTTVLGVVVGTGTPSTEHGEDGYFNADQLELRHIPADTAGLVGVAPAEGILFEIQTAVDLDLVQGDAANFGNNTGNTTTGNSTQEIINVTTPVDVKVVEDNLAPDNDVSLAFARHLVQFLVTEHAL